MATRIHRLSGWLAASFGRAAGNFTNLQGAQRGLDGGPDMTLVRDIGPTWPDAPVPIPARSR